jgi:hypothetical protein
MGWRNGGRRDEGEMRKRRNYTSIRILRSVGEDL